jgi:hypothetical protein
MPETTPKLGPPPGPIGDELAEPAGAPLEGGGVSSGPLRAPVLAVLAVGLLVGVVSWLIGEVAEGAFAPRTVTATIRIGVQTQLITDTARAVATIRNVALSSGLFGALLALALGLTGGLARGSAGAARHAALVGLVAGACGGAGAAWGVLTLFYRSFLHFTPEGVIEPLLMHASIWGIIGAVGGLAFGMGLGGRGQAAQALVGGLIGAVLGAVLYEVLGAAAFPLSRTTAPTALDWGPRLLARLLVASLASLGAALAVAPRRPAAEKTARMSPSPPPPS